MPLAAGRIEKAVCALLYAAAGGGACAAVCPVAAAAWIATVAGAALGAIVWRPLRGSLRWDGASWSIVVGDGSAYRVDAPLRCIDAGGWLLLRLTGGKDRHPGWASVRASDAGGRWHDLRVALVAHGRMHREGAR